MTDQAGVFPVPKVTLADGTVSAKTEGKYAWAEHLVWET